MMNSFGRRPGKNKPEKRTPKTIYILAGVLIVTVVVIIIIKGVGPSGRVSAGADIKITKSQITSTATFIPYWSENTKMEVLAVKAPDGTIRTAFNTCQVCYNSGRGYYVQQGDTLVCQNCGNIFRISQVEKEKNGCNPVPISETVKTDDGQTITIPAGFLSQYAGLFLKWKK